MNTCKIITYHYVRPLAHSRYPNLKALDYELFKKQVQYIKKKYTVITMERFIDAVYSPARADGQICGGNLPENSCLLAFDDAYLDHYQYVFPILANEGMQGSFFVPVLPMILPEVLQVNKIHLLLATVEASQLKTEIARFLIDNDFGITGFDVFYDQYTENNRFDDKDTMFVKRFLQRFDDKAMRLKCLNNLCLQFLGDSEKTIHQELYMNIDQLKHMKAQGMYIGAHTVMHPHLNSISMAEQKIEINRSKNFLICDNNLCDEKYLTLSYPYGSHNQTTKDLLKQQGYKLGIGIDFGIATLGHDFDAFNVPRVDCNDITKEMENNL